MIDISLTVLLVIVLFAVGFGAAIASSRINRQLEQSSFDLPGSGLLIKPTQKPSRNPIRWRADWLHGFSTEMFGAIVTTVLFDLVLTALQQNENTAERKRILP